MVSRSEKNKNTVNDTVGAWDAWRGGTEMTSNLLNNGRPPLYFVRKAKLKVAPLELPFVIKQKHETMDVLQMGMGKQVPISRNNG